MTREDGPVRLRTLGHDLPADLALALEGSPEEAPTLDDLTRLRTAVASALHDSPRDSGVFAWRPRRPAPFQRALGLAMTFAVGAGAGVAVSGGAALVARLLTASQAENVVARGAPNGPAAGAGQGAKRAGRSPSAWSPASATPNVAAPAEAPSPVPVPTVAIPPSVPQLGASSSTRRHEDATPSVPAPSAVSSTASREELALLAHAQAALARDPNQALALVSAHERAFPRGSLAQEREVLAIDALVRLGRKSEAEARARDFHRTFPTSAHGRRVDVLVGAPTHERDHN